MIIKRYCSRWPQNVGPCINDSKYLISCSEDNFHWFAAAVVEFDASMHVHHIGSFGFQVIDKAAHL